MKIIDEFKSFAVKGNVIDMTVGIIIGAAVGKIVTSFVNDVIMPPIGILIGGVKVATLKSVLKEAVGETTDSAINYGNVLQGTFDWLSYCSGYF